MTVSVANREEEYSHDPIRTLWRWILSGFRLRLLPPPTEAVLSLTELRSEVGRGCVEVTWGLWGRRTRCAGRFEPGPFVLAKALKADVLEAAVLRVPKASGYRVSLRCDHVPSPRMAQPYYPPSLTVGLGLFHASPTHRVFRVAPCTLPAPVPSSWISLNPTPVLQLSQRTPPALSLLPHLTRLFGHCCSLCPLSLTTSDSLAPSLVRYVAPVSASLIFHTLFLVLPSYSRYP